MGSDPYEGAIHQTSDQKFKRGDKLYHPRIGECTFYKHDLLRQKVEVFDKYGVLRYVTDKEIFECQLVKSKES